MSQSIYRSQGFYKQISGNRKSLSSKRTMESITIHHKSYRLFLNLRGHQYRVSVGTDSLTILLDVPFSLQLLETLIGTNSIHFIEQEYLRDGPGEIKT